jgi:hypothetical protein
MLIKSFVSNSFAKAPDIASVSLGVLVRLTEANHPDHQIIVYPDLGHNFVPSNQWVSSGGQIEEYVLVNGFPLHRDRNSLLLCSL